MKTLREIKKNFVWVNHNDYMQVRYFPEMCTVLPNINQFLHLYHANKRKK